MEKGYSYQEIPSYQKVDRIYIKREEKDAELRHSRFNEALQSGYISEMLTDWDSKSRQDMLTKNPRIVIPVDLAHSEKKISEIVQKLPYIPYARSEDEPNILIAAGIPTGEIRNGFDQNHKHDDALREFLIELERSDADSPVEKMKSYLEEKGFEDAFMVASNIITVLKLYPPLAIPLMAARGVINVRDLAHSRGIDIVRRFSRTLDNPDTYARVKRLTKHFFEKTEDHEFQDAMTLLKTPEALSYLKNNGVEGKTLALVDDEHAPGEDLWTDAEKQYTEASSAMQDLILLRQELATAYGEKLSINEWAAFKAELVKYFGGVTIYAVKNRPPVSTIGTVAASITEMHTFTSQKIEELINRSFLALGIRTEEDAYPGSSLNDF